MKRKFALFFVVLLLIVLSFADYNPPMFSTSSTKGLTKIGKTFTTLDLSQNITSEKLNVPALVFYKGNSEFKGATYYRVDFVFDSYQYKYLIPYLKLDIYSNIKKVSSYYYGKKTYSDFLKVQRVNSNKYVVIIRFNSEKIIINNKSYKATLPIVFRFYTTKAVAGRFTSFNSLYKIERSQKVSNVKVNFSSSPSGAIVYLGAKMLGIAPFYTYLKPGSYLVRFFKKGFPEKDIKFIAEGESVNVVASFTPSNPSLISKGTVILSINPPDANIMFNGKLSPQNVFNLPVGTYTVSISADGYQNTYFTFKVEAGKTKTYKVNLQPIYSTLILNIKPANAKVYVDNEYIPGNVFKLKPGIHGIVVKSNGYKDNSFAVNLNPGENMSINVTLKPLMGYLTVKANTVSDVYIDGEYVGKTSLLNYELSPGLHDVEIKNSNFDFITTIVIEGGKLKTIDLNVSIN